MTILPSGEKLRKEIEKDVIKRQKGERERSTLMAQTVYLGTVGIIIVLPIVAGAYLGSWLDQQLTGFSFSWTISLIIIGVFVGCTNAFIFIRRNDT